MRRRASFTRAERLGSLMRDEVTRVVDFELTDQVIRHVQITDAVLAGDLGHLRVRYVMRGTEEPSERAQQALDRAAGYVARSLSESLQLHRAPKVVFSFDREYAHLRKLQGLLHPDGVPPAAVAALTAAGMAAASAQGPGAADDQCREEAPRSHEG